MLVAVEQPAVVRRHVQRVLPGVDEAEQVLELAPDGVGVLAVRGVERLPALDSVVDIQPDLVETEVLAVLRAVLGLLRVDQVARLGVQHEHQPVQQHQRLLFQLRQRSLVFGVDVQIVRLDEPLPEHPQRGEHVVL
nr:hypothetical protein [Halolamina pelagica]